jgi:hypothetical protein
MVSVQGLVDAGMRCPSCKGTRLRAGYHDWHNMDCLICEECGLRWTEDSKGIKLSDARWFTEPRFIWVLAYSEHPLFPILNPKSSDDSKTSGGFIRTGINNCKKRILNSV